MPSSTLARTVARHRRDPHFAQLEASARDCGCATDPQIQVALALTPARHVHQLSCNSD